MLALVLGTLRFRTAQAAAVLILTVLATAAATAGPWYLSASQRRAAVAEVAAAPAAQRLLSVRRTTPTAGDPATALANFQTSVRSQLPIPATDGVLGVTYSLLVTYGSTTSAAPLAYRDGVCEQLRLTGSCPRAPDEAVISQYAAQLLRLDIGDRLVLREFPTTPPLSLRIVGRYDVVDPGSVYWADPLFGLSTGGSGDQAKLDAVFVPLETFAGPELREATFAYDLPVPDRLIRGDGGYDLAPVLRKTDQNLRAAGFFLVTPAQDLLRLIAEDSSTIQTGVLVNTVQVVVLCWFALGLAGWYTARQRRHDVALLKLRGTTRPRMLRLALGQHLVPTLLGVALGAVVGLLSARWFAGPVPDPARMRSALALCALAAAIVVVGAMLVLTVTELAALRSPVATLLRRLPTRRRGWRSDVVDVLLIVAAVAGAYQADNDAGPGLALAAPILVMLAVALLLARLLAYLAHRGAAAALRAGRLRLGLTSVQISRQPGLNRVFALVAVAVAALATAAGGWSADRAADMDRTSAELGAARVLTVQAGSRAALLYAVRQADPDGRQAMAAVANLTASPPVLAVDSSRLSAVATWRVEFGPLPMLSGTPVDADAPPAIAPVTGSGLTLHARNDGTEPVELVAQLENRATGVAVPVRLGPLPAGEHEVTAAVPGCTTAPGCRLVRLELWAAGPDGQPYPPPPGTSVTIAGLAQSGPTGSILDGAALGDSRRWRGNTTGLGLTVLAQGSDLMLSVPSPGQGPSTGSPGGDEPDNRVFVVDTVLPLPVVLAGPPPSTWVVGDANLDPFGRGVPPAGATRGGSVPVRVVATAAALPVLGRNGVIVDLGSAQQVLADAGTAGTFQVWLAPGTPEPVVGRLRGAGLTVLADDSATSRQHRLAEQGPAVTSGFALLAAAVGLLLAAAGLATAATADRTARTEDLHALRIQGLSRRVAFVVAYVGYAALIVTAVIGGLLASVVAHAVVSGPQRHFTDGWRVLDPPSSLAPGVLAVTGLAALVVLGLAWWASMAPGGRGTGRAQR